jgi:hypothetical protein
MTPGYLVWEAYFDDLGFGETYQAFTATEACYVIEIEPWGHHAYSVIYMPPGRGANRIIGQGVSTVAEGRAIAQKHHDRAEL